MAGSLADGPSVVGAAACSVGASANHLAAAELLAAELLGGGMIW